MPYKAIPGIYRIMNIVNNKCYIGSAVCIKKRFRQHRILLTQNKHYNNHFQAAWNKYGEHSFKFEIIESVPTELLLKAEQYWIDLCSVNNTKLGYNKRLLASTNLGLKLSEETRRKLSIAHMGHKKSDEIKAKIGAAQRQPVIQIAFNGTIVAEYSSFKEAAKRSGAHATAISMCCSKKNISTAGYYWCRKEELDQFKLPDPKHQKSHTLRNKNLWNKNH